MKLSPHLLGGSKSGKVLAEAGATLCLQTDNFDSTYSAYPGLIIIGRRNSNYPNTNIVVTAENLRQSHGPQEAAQAWVNIQSDAYRLNPFIRFWVGPNEPQFESPDTQSSLAGYQWYSDFEIERIRLLSLLGLKAVVGQFSVGKPDMSLTNQNYWKAFLPALQHALLAGGMLGLHQYDAGDLSQQWTAMRHELVYDLVLRPNGLGSLPIAITEFGLLSYKQKFSDTQYAQQLIDANARLNDAAYVAGATIFTCSDTSDKWGDYNIEGTNVAALVVAGVKSQLSPTLTSLPTSPIPQGTPPMTQPQPSLSPLNLDFSLGTYQQPDTRGKPHETTLIPKYWQALWQEGQDQPQLGDPKTPWLMLDSGLVKGGWQAARPYGKSRFELSQLFAPPAGQYAFTAKVIACYNVSQPSDPLSYEWYPFAISAQDIPFPVEGPWLNGNFNQSISKTILIAHPGGPLTIGIQARARYGLPVVQWLVEPFTFGLVSSAPVVTPPSSSPVPPIVISSTNADAKAKLLQAQTLITQALTEL